MRRAHVLKNGVMFMLHLFAGLDLTTGLLLVLALLFVLFYEAINGFHDTAITTASCARMARV